MALLIPSSRDGETSLLREPEVVPPLFAGLFRDELVRQHFDNALQQALHELAEDRFAASLGKFREALTLSRSQEALKRKLDESAITEAARLVEHNWRVAEALLLEVGQAPDPLRSGIEYRRREEAIQVALDESGRAEHTEYLPHVRNRLAELDKTYPGDSRVEARLKVLDGLLAQRDCAEREKNLRRLTLFRERLNATDNPETVRRFRALVAPFADPYSADPEFAAILEDAGSLLAAYEDASARLAEGQPRECLQICNQVLERAPGNTLFRLLEEKAKAREWVALLAGSTMQRAQAFAQDAKYAEALGELESLRSIDPDYPGLDSEILHCAALQERWEALRLPEAVYEPAALEEPAGVKAAEPEIWPVAPNPLPSGFKIAITKEAWNHLKTGFAATFALLMVILLLASNLRK